MPGEPTLHVAQDPPARPMYRLTLNVSGQNFDVDVTVDGVARLTPELQRLVLAVLDEAVRATYEDDGGGE